MFIEKLSKKKFFQIGDEFEKVINSLKNNEGDEEEQIELFLQICKKAKHFDNICKSSCKELRSKGKKRIIEDTIQNTGIVKKKDLEKEIIKSQLNINSKKKRAPNMKDSFSGDIIKKHILKNEEYIPKINSRCYICSENYDEIHHFYHKLCKICGDFNEQKRNQLFDLTGKIALVTGGRVKIGYQVCIQLLRNKCSVIATTRFPKDAIKRFSEEKDFDEWKDRILVYGIDFRNISKVYEFCNFLKERFNRLDIIINNAAQSIRRDFAYFSHLKEFEEKDFEENDPKKNILLNSSNELNNFPLQFLNQEKQTEVKNQKSIMKHENQDKSHELSLVPLLKSENYLDISKFPEQVLDINKQQVDLSNRNSWVKQIDEIEFTEFVEAQFINSWSPYILISELKSIFKENFIEQKKFIINVTSSEGRFNLENKTSAHPHTNMSKAALNMITRTCGAHFEKFNVYMNSVDTGWISEMKPKGFLLNRDLPLDEIDGAMRIIDPIFSGLKNKDYNVHSALFKDYKELRNDKW